MLLAVMLRLALVGLTLLAISGDTGRAQRYGPVMEGEKIRFRYCGEVDREGHGVDNCATEEGRVLRVAGDTLVVDRKGGGGSLTTRFTWLTKLEVSHGYKSRVLPGVVVGAIAVAILAEGDLDTSGSSFCNDHVGECALVGLALVGTGAAVGLLLSGEKWEEIPPDLFRVSVVAHRDGRLAAGFSVRF